MKRHELRHERLYVTAFGSKGTQVCRFIGHSTNGDDRVRVTKFRRKSSRWTQPMLVPAESILRAATRDEAEQVNKLTRAAARAAALQGE